MHDRTRSRRLAIVAFVAIVVTATVLSASFLFGKGRIIDRVESLLGVSVANVFHDPKLWVDRGFSGTDTYIAAGVTKSDFDKLSKALGLVRRDDLRSYYPGMFEFQAPAWWISGKNDRDEMYFRDDFVEERLIAAVYRDGTVYLLIVDY